VRVNSGLPSLRASFDRSGCTGPPGNRKSTRSVRALSTPGATVDCLDQITRPVRARPCEVARDRKVVGTGVRLRLEVTIERSWFHAWPQAQSDLAQQPLVINLPANCRIRPAHAKTDNYKPAVCHHETCDHVGQYSGLSLAWRGGSAAWRHRPRSFHSGGRSSWAAAGMLAPEANSRVRGTPVSACESLRSYPDFVSELRAMVPMTSRGCGRSKSYPTPIRYGQEQNGIVSRGDLEGSHENGAGNGAQNSAGNLCFYPDDA